MLTRKAPIWILAGCDWLLKIHDHVGNRNGPWRYCG